MPARAQGDTRMRAAKWQGFRRFLPVVLALALVLGSVPWTLERINGSGQDASASFEKWNAHVMSLWGQSEGRYELSQANSLAPWAMPAAFQDLALEQASSNGWLWGTTLAPVGNDVARHSILGIDQIWQQLSLYGQGQIVAVADTGLDTGRLETLSADFAGRVRQTFALGRTGDWSDPNGHGTHVAGSVLGSGVLSGSDPAGHRYDASIAGAAPEAELVFQSLLDADGGLGGLPADLQGLLQQAYDAGARIHTNSWGANFFLKPLTRFLSAGRYTQESAQVDAFIWNHPDMVVLFAAGNDGVDYFTGSSGGLELPPPDGVVDPSSLASPGTAKNVITVGASEGLRASGGHSQEPWGSDEDILSAVMGYSYTAEPIASDVPSDNPDGMAPFSSRGPSNDGRIKPDVVAPGTNILSAASHASGAGELFGRYDANYVYCSGTSMATPLVAGTVTLIRQWYVDRMGVGSPSAALIKATLINGATDISPGQFGAGGQQDVPDAWPNSVTGWGRVNLVESINPGNGREVWFQDVQLGLETGQEAEFLRGAAASSEPLRVTLVWTDPPGPIEPEGFNLPGLTEQPPPELVNDLDLLVKTPDGRQFWGNMGQGPDRLNNVEAVRVANPVAGNYQVIVRAHQVAQGPQPFALVVAGQQVLSGPSEVQPLPTTVTEPTTAVLVPTAGADGSQTALPVEGPTVGPGLQEPVAPSATAEADTGAEGPGEQVPALEGEDADGLPAWTIPMVVVLVVSVVGLAGAVLYAVRRQRGVLGRGAQAMVTGFGGSAGLQRADLRILEGPLAGKTVAISSSPFALGRGEECELVLPDDHGSRRHASLEARDGRWVLHDHGSANGTFLNRQRLESPQPLRSGDLMYVGQSVLLFQLRPDASGGRVPEGRPARSRRRGSAIAVILGVTLVLMTLAAAGAILLTMEPAESGGGDLLPGMPDVGLPTVVLPTGLPSLEIPTGLPTLDIPTGLPLLPTGGIPLPTISLPGLGGGMQ